MGTKVFFPTGPGPDDRGLGRMHVLRQCDESLRQLGLEHIDVYQCHRYDADTPLEETCRAMDDLVRMGKIRHWGVSEWTPEQIAEAVDLCRREGLAPPATDQPRSSMRERAAEAEVLPACARLGLGVVVFSPLAQGMLTGKYRRAGTVPEGSRAADPEGRMFIHRFFTKEHFARVERLRSLAASLGIELGQLAIAWVLRRPEVTSAIVGASRPDQVDGNVTGVGVDLDAETLRRIEEALG